MIYRTYFCLNRNCKHEFTVVDQDHPPCPRCAGTKVQWLPRTTGVMSAKTASIDNTVKDLVKTYGDKNYSSPARAGERAAPRVNPSPVAGQTRRFAPAAAAGWAVDVPIDRNGGYAGAYCGPAGVTAKVSHGVGVRTSLDPRSPTPTGSVPKIEGTHRP